MQMKIDDLPFSPHRGHAGYKHEEDSLALCLVSIDLHTHHASSKMIIQMKERTFFLKGKRRNRVNIDAGSYTEPIVR